MSCKFYKRTECAGSRTCTNERLTTTKYCPFVANGKFLNEKAKCTCKGFAPKVGQPHREYTPDILRSTMAGIIDTMPSMYDKVIVTVDVYADGCAAPMYQAKVPIVRNDIGSGFMTRKVFCRISGMKASKRLREAIKKFKAGIRRTC